MTTREKFKRRVIELIHGLPYEEAVERELQENCLVIGRLDEVYKICDTGKGKGNKGKYYAYYDQNFYLIDTFEKILGLPITIGRVMQAFNKVKPTNVNPLWQLGVEMNDKKINWKLTKENGENCTDDDQTDETIEKLYNLI